MYGQGFLTALFADIIEPRHEISNNVTLKGDYIGSPVTTQLKGRLHMLACVYTCQNVTSLEIIHRGSNIEGRK